MCGDSDGGDGGDGAQISSRRYLGMAENWFNWASPFVVLVASSGDEAKETEEGQLGNFLE